MSSKPMLYLMVGLPGSGKTTIAKQIEKEENAIRLCPDEWMHDLGFDSYDEAAREKVEGRLWELGQEILALGQSVILENGFWVKKEREQIRAKAKEIGADVEIRYLDLPLDELEARLLSRNTDPNDNSAHVTREQLEEWSQTFERPTKEELDS